MTAALRFRICWRMPAPAARRRDAAASRAPAGPSWPTGRATAGTSGSIVHTGRGGCGAGEKLRHQPSLGHTTVIARLAGAPSRRAYPRRHWLKQRRLPLGVAIIHGIAIALQHDRDHGAVGVDAADFWPYGGGAITDRRSQCPKDPCNRTDRGRSTGMASTRTLGGTATAGRPELVPPALAHPHPEPTAGADKAGTAIMHLLVSGQLPSLASIHV